MKQIVLDPTLPPLLKQKTSHQGATEISENFTLRNTDGKLVAIYINNFVDKTFGKFFSKIKFQDSHRTSGIKSSSQIFGFAPRDDLKRLPGRFCKFNTENKDIYKVLQSLSKKFEEKFKQLEPETYSRHAERSKVIRDAWKINGSNYTSGIINNSTQYAYHTDNGNVEGTLSSMLTFKNGISGGNLHLPEYNILIKNDDCSLLIFDGARTSHGVDEFKKLNADSYRITIVWYVLDKLKNCAETPALEVSSYNNKVKNVKFNKSN